MRAKARMHMGMYPAALQAVLHLMREDKAKQHLSGTAFRESQQQVNEQNESCYHGHKTPARASLFFSLRDVS